MRCYSGYMYDGGVKKKNDGYVGGIKGFGIYVK